MLVCVCLCKREREREGGISVPGGMLFSVPEDVCLFELSGFHNHPHACAASRLILCDKEMESYRTNRNLYADQSVYSLKRTRTGMMYFLEPLNVSFIQYFETT